MKKNILQGLLIAVFVLFASQSRAQLGNEQISSSKPIYSHQYTFLDSDQYYFIDTSFNSLHWYHQFNHTGADLFEYSVLGSMGNPMNRLTIPVIENIWSYNDMAAYDPYFKDMARIPFYYTRSPITEANFWMGYDRGQSFNISHTQNINKDWNFVINYKRLNDLGFYNHNRNIQSTFLANSNYVNERLGYEAYIYFLHERMDTEENGGIVSDSLFEANVGEKILLNVNLEEDTRTLRNREFYLDQSIALNKLLGLGKPDSLRDEKKSRNRLAIGYTFRYNKESNTYKGYTTEGYYQNYFVPEANYSDSSYYKSFENTYYIEGKLGSETKLDVKAGVKNLITEYGGTNYQFASNNWGITGALNGKVLDRIEVNATTDYILTGQLKESFDLEVNGKLKLLKWLDAFGGYRFSLKYPDFFDHFYYSNNFIWQNTLQKQSSSLIHYGIKWGKTNMLEISNYGVGNFTYYNEDAMPVQASDPVRVFRAKLKQNFTFFNFLHFDNQVYYQNVFGEIQALPLPEWVSRNALYFEFHLFNKALKCLAGAEVKYFSEYNSPSYNPATGRFYNAGEKAIGNYPLVDAFANFELRSARIFVKYEHVNEGLGKYAFYAAPHYPFPDRVLRIGITWRFFN